jgi:hypothetical protein
MKCIQFAKTLSRKASGQCAAWVQYTRVALLPLCISTSLSAAAPGSESNTTAAAFTPSYTQAQTTHQNHRHAAPALDLTQVQHVVVETWPADQAQLQWLMDHFDVWRQNYRNKAWPVRLQPKDLERLDALGIRFEIDQARSLELNQPIVLEEQLGSDTIPGFSCYRSVEKTIADIQQLPTQFPNLARIEDIGDSWMRQNGQGGNDILALVLTNQNRPGPKPPLVIISAIHAREYATAELATRFAEELLNGYDQDADATWLLNEFEIHIIPQLNPDGRGIAEVNSTRFKRKNDNTNFCNNGDTTSRGVDLNRNSTVLWGGLGTSTNECSDVYRGPNAASEPETQAIEAYMGMVFTDQRPGDHNDLQIAAPDDAEGMFISIHSFSELVLFPWEGVANNSSNHAAMRTLSRKLAFFNDYAACQDCLGQTAGTTVDYAYGEYGVASLTYEIGTTFFQSCNSFNNTVLPDNLASLRFAAKSARRPYQQPGAPEAINVQVSIDQASPNIATLSAQIDDTRRRQVSDDGGEPADSADNISAAYYTIDTPEWAGASLIPMQSTDGQFNSATEMAQAQLDTSTLSLGRHLLFVYGEDSSGLGVPSAVFLEVVENDQILRDSFEAQP